jgi:TonB family protein
MSRRHAGFIAQSRQVSAVLLLTLSAALSHAQGASTTGLPNWFRAYRDCAEQALVRRVPEASASTPKPQEPVAAVESECADRLPKPGPDANPLTINAVVSVVRLHLYRHFQRAPANAAAASAPGERETIQIAEGVDCPKPEYPAAALRAGASGTTIVELRVDGGGNVVGGDIVTPSGLDREHRMMDGSAVESFIACSFPATGVAHAVKLSFVWRLAP